MAASVCWTCVLSLLEKSHDWKKKEWKQENDKILMINVTNNKNIIPQKMQGRLYVDSILKESII